MEQKQGLKNFSLNIKRTINEMAAMNTQGKSARLTVEQERELVNFYLEVVDYLSK